MYYLEGAEEQEGVRWMEEARRIARDALCTRARCGSVIVFDGQIIGYGYNAPPGDDLAHAKCDFAGDRSKKPKYDLTCCVHAEWRAIMDALRKNEDKVAGSRLYFMRIGDDGSKTHAGEPFCTVCSRLALDAGVTEFALFDEKGIAVYGTKEYNDLSYDFHKN